MYVKRFRLYSVKCLRRDIPEEGPLPEPARDRLLFQGANGSGKTTILETVANLWHMFGEWIDAGAAGRIAADWARHYLAHSEMAAVEFCGFGRGLESLWVGIGKGNAWQDLKNQNPGSQFAGMITFGAAKGEPKFTLELPDLDLQTVREQALDGRATMPNVVYFPPEERLLQSGKTERGKRVYRQDYRWTAEFAPAIDLEAPLITTKALDGARYDQAIGLANQLLQHQKKKLTLRGRGHVVELATATGIALEHPLEQLSSGEKQIVLMVVFAACMLQPGGILILDEPDLHIHMALVQPLVAVLHHLVRERNGQLIVAAHSQQVWTWFGQSAERVTLGAWRGSAK